MSRLSGLTKNFRFMLRSGAIGVRTRKAYESFTYYLDKPNRDFCPDLSAVKPYEATTKFADSLNCQTFAKFPKQTLHNELSSYALVKYIKSPNYLQSIRSKSRLAKDGIIDSFNSINNIDRIKSLVLKVNTSQSRIKDLFQRMLEMRAKTKNQVLTYVEVIRHPRNMSFIRETSQKLATFRENWNQAKLKESLWLRLGTANGAVKESIHKLYYTDAKAKNVIGLKDKNEVIIKKNDEIYSNRK